MALNIKDDEAVRLATEVATLAGESKTRAIKVALQERHERLMMTHVNRDRGADLQRFLEHEVWPQVPPRELGRPLSREQREGILGYGPGGV
jgi:antitoxin VapB